MLRAQAGSLADFNGLVQRHAGPLFDYLHARLRNHADAEDLVQTTFVTAWRGLNRFDPTRAFKPWLFAIARRRLIDFVRRRQARPRTDPAPAEDIAVDAAQSPRERLEHENEVEQLWHLAREVLSPRQLDVLWLRYREDMDVRQVARATKLTQVHVKVLLHRARNRLAQAYANHADLPARDTAPEPLAWKAS